MVFVWVDTVIQFTIIKLIKGTNYKSTDMKASRTCLVKHSQDATGLFLLFRARLDDPRFERSIQAQVTVHLPIIGVLSAASNCASNSLSVVLVTVFYS
jgi:hypothetical protein